MSQLKLSNLFTIEKKIKSTTGAVPVPPTDILMPDFIIEVPPPTQKILKQRSIVDTGVSVVVSGEDVSNQFANVRKKGKYSSREIVPLVHRPEFCNELFKNNKVSDEYYTEIISWWRFLHTYNLIGKTVFEPFYGDGTSTRELNKIVNVVGVAGGRFFDIYDRPEFDGLFVLSNPPFSFKWQVIITLLEQRRDFALILPWETFYDKKDKNGNVVEICPLKMYQRKFGGKYIYYKCRDYEQYFFHPTDDKETHTVGRSGVYKKIGTHILYWRFDGDFSRNEDFVEMDEQELLNKRTKGKVFKSWKNMTLKNRRK